MRLVVVVICCLAVSESRPPRVVKRPNPNVKLSQDSPSYPITGSWFKDRYLESEWNETLSDFTSLGGDTVLLRAPPVVMRSPNDIRSDPNFRYCVSQQKKPGMDIDCVTEARKQLTEQRLTIVGYATYEYEEDYGETIIQCPKYDRRINGSRIYHRLVIPLEPIKSNRCELEKNTEVVVIFTSFSGVDSKHLLLQSAKKTNVYLGLPSIGNLAPNFTNFYLQLTNRILNDHRARYSAKLSTSAKNITLYEKIKGYYSNPVINLAEVMEKHLLLYKATGQIVHGFGKKFVISPGIILNRSFGNFTVADHVRGFEILARMDEIDVIAVHEGRGEGLGAYFWPTEVHKSVVSVDPFLDKIIRYLDASVPKNATFDEQFTGSNNVLFVDIRRKRDVLVSQGVKVEYWLMLEAFENLPNNPCLPIDRSESGMGRMVERTSKFRLDKSLTVIGAQPEKIIAFAWDPDFTCTSRNDSWSLTDDIRQDGGRPIIANCSFHSRNNMSVVVIGFNLLALTQSFTVDYPSLRGGRKTEKVYGYYYETDYGLENHRSPDLVYIQLYDVMDVYYLPDHGIVTVSADSAYHSCTFAY